jgi:methyl coenzyme M reductase subunit C
LDQWESRGEEIVVDNVNWISQKEAANRLGCAYRIVPRVVAEAGVRTRQLPGCRTHYHAGDIADVVACAVRGEGREKAKVAS